MNDQPADCPMPEEVGDVYALLDYIADDMAVLGYAYPSPDPYHPDRWCWWLSLDDGDQYPWINTAELLDATGAGAIVLVRRQMAGLEEAVREAVPAAYLPSLSIRPYFAAVIPTPPLTITEAERAALEAHGIDTRRFP